MIQITKRDWELICIGHKFRRNDGHGWLAADETLLTATVSILDESGTDVTNQMLYGSPSVDGQRALYWLQNGGTTVDVIYTLNCQVTTSRGQKFQDVVEIVMQ